MQLEEEHLELKERQRLESSLLKKKRLLEISRSRSKSNDGAARRDNENAHAPNITKVTLKNERTTVSPSILPKPNLPRKPIDLTKQNTYSP